MNWFIFFSSCSIGQIIDDVALKGTMHVVYTPLMQYKNVSTICSIHFTFSIDSTGDVSISFIVWSYVPYDLSGARYG